jgi:hypothetical protein
VNLGIELAFDAETGRATGYPARGTLKAETVTSRNQPNPRIHALCWQGFLSCWASGRGFGSVFLHHIWCCYKTPDRFPARGFVLYSGGNQQDGDQGRRPTGSKSQDIQQHPKASVTASFFFGSSSRSVRVRPLESEGNWGTSCRYVTYRVACYNRLGYNTKT